MREDADAFLEAAAMRAIEAGYHDLPEDECLRIGEQAFPDYAAVLAVLGPSVRKQHVRAMVERLGSDYILFV